MTDYLRIFLQGAPIELRPLDDDPELAKDPNRNNFFDYDYVGSLQITHILLLARLLKMPRFHLQTDEVQDQTRCPFAAHIRKTAPRSWLQTGYVPSFVANDCWILDISLLQ